MAQGLGTSTEKQVRFAITLLEKNNYPTRRVGEQHAELAPIAGHIDRSVERWLHSMSKEQVASIIDRLVGS